jgi:hypothetical protein
MKLDCGKGVGTYFSSGRVSQCRFVQKRSITAAPMKQFVRNGQLQRRCVTAAECYRAGPQKIVVGPTFTSYGYLPGPIEAGSWAVILGVPNIRGGSTDTYSISIEQLDREEPSFPVIRHEAAWFTGDFHSHSGHSDGHAEVLGGTQTKIPPHRVFEAARRVGLDFVALTDHNTTSHWTEVERLQSYYNNLLLLHAREVTTYNGHLNAFGEREFTDFRVTTDRPLEVILDELTSRGVFISINHPALPDDESCMGCGWTSGAKPEVMRRVNGIEIVNGDRAEGPLSGWATWAKMLNAGYHLTAIGGSDEHTADETRDRPIGTPATVVYADGLSEPALLDGLRKGRAYVRTRGPQGPTLQFEAARRTSPGEWENCSKGGNRLHPLGERISRDKSATAMGTQWRDYFDVTRCR